MASLSNFFSPGGSETKSTNYLPQQATTLAKALNLYGAQLGQNENIYGGQRVAELTPLQSNVLAGMPNYLNLYSTPAGATTQPLSAETGTALKSILAGQTGAQPISREQTEDYFANAFYNPTMRMMKQDIMPSIDEGYTGGNFFGTARGKARQKATESVANSLTQQRSQLDWDVLGRNQQIADTQAGRTLAAVPQAMQYGREPAAQTLANLQIAASQVEGMQQLFGFGQAEQTQEQRELESEIAKFAEENQITDPQNMQILLQLLGYNYTVSKGEQAGRGTGNQWLAPMA